MQFRKAGYVSLALIAIASIVASILCAQNINGDLRLFKTKLDISFNNNKFTYNGEKISASDINYEFLNGKLAYNDTLEITLNNEIKYVGNYNKTNLSYKIVNGSGIDVTDSYDISETFENIQIEKRTISFRSVDGFFTANHVDAYIFEGAYISKGSLANGEYFNCTNFSSFLYAGTFENKFEVSIYNNDGIKTNSNYNIKKEYGVVIGVKY